MESTIRDGNLMPNVSYRGRGITSRQDISVEISLQSPGDGIVFEVEGDGKSVFIPALSKYVVNTMRNVVLGRDGKRLCIVEHFLAAASLWGIKGLKVKVNGPEMPFGDGSAQFWIELFQKAGWQRRYVSPTITLKEPIVVNKGDRLLMAIPDERFSVSYHMDWKHPLIGKRWQSWDAESSVESISLARTFGPLQEHKLLGLENEVVSLTDDGFSQPLRFDDEPIRHKILDLIGDLTLTGVNPMAFQAKFVSIKAGHELDVVMAQRLCQQEQSVQL